MEKMEKLNNIGGRESFKAEIYRVLRLTRRDFEDHNDEITKLLIGTSHQLLKQGASFYDVLTFAGYPLMDVLNPVLHANTALEFIYMSNSEEPVGWVLNWSGREHLRRHLYLPNEIARDFIESYTNTSSANRLSFSVLMKEDSDSSLREGFRESDISSFAGWSLRPDRRGARIVRNHKMYLTREMFRRVKKPEITIPLSISEYDYRPRRVFLPYKVAKNLPYGEDPRKIFVRRLTMADYQLAEQLHFENNDHPTLKPADIIYPNYAVIAGGRFIAMSGSVSETVLPIDHNNIPLVLAGNLVVDRKWRNSGLGSALSYATKEQTFRRYPECLIITDCNDNAKKIWSERYKSPLVCTTGWLALERS